MATQPQQTQKPIRSYQRTRLDQSHVATTSRIPTICKENASPSTAATSTIRPNTLISPRTYPSSSKFCFLGWEIKTSCPAEADSYKYTTVDRVYIPGSDG